MKNFPYIDWDEGYCCEDRCGANGAHYLFLSDTLSFKLDESEKDITEKEVRRANKILAVKKNSMLSNLLNLGNKNEKE